MSQLTWLDDHSADFPPTSSALEDPNGLLAVGGTLSPDRLINAYSQGIFPWYSEGQPVLWWSPSPRMALEPAKLHLGRSTKKLIRKRIFSVTVDRCFDSVIHHCAAVKRQHEDGTWITDEIMEAYAEMHRLGLAHSIETWRDGELVGGLYGINIGKAFFGESMFSLESGASKVAFSLLAMQLKTWNFQLIDCQIYTDYLASFGATEMNRNKFEQKLAKAVEIPHSCKWSQQWSMPAYGPESFE
ncbi:Leucyl/phenylalanyl-tRNA--protein transferase [Thalassocella blandensis]|nr:Leucyl/phenylalanyl-tRNA--protein transferase [Thalassocella blandensis]